MDGRRRSLIRPAVLLLVVLLALPAGVAWGRTVGGAFACGREGSSRALLARHRRYASGWGRR
jgi:hypothetical protein